MKYGYLSSLFLVLLAVVGCVNSELANNRPAAELLSHVVLSLPKDVGSYPFGGISGLDYDPEKDRYIAISDDKGEYGPARAYRFYLSASNQLQDVEEFSLDGSFSANMRPTNIDAEAVRFIASDEIVWSSETGHVFITNLKQQQTRQFSLPTEILPQENGSNGARDNNFIEGISFLDDREKIALALEAPLRQDGPLATADKGGFSRILIFDFARQKLLSEYFYPLDAIPKESTVEPKLSDNGVSEILAIDNNHLLVLERSGRHIGNMDFAYDVRCYLIDLSKTAAEVPTSANEKQPVNAQRPLLQKTLLFRLGDLISPQENFEGISLRSSKTGGENESHITVSLVSDSGFHAARDTYLTSVLLTIPQRKQQLLNE